MPELGNRVTRWTDDRMDDLATLVKANDTRTDRLNDLVEAHDRDLKQIAKTGDRRRSNSLTVWLLLASIVLTGAVNLIVTLVATSH